VKLSKVGAELAYRLNAITLDMVTALTQLNTHDEESIWMLC